VRYWHDQGNEPSGMTKRALERLAWRRDRDRRFYCLIAMALFWFAAGTGLTYGLILLIRR